MIVASGSTIYLGGGAFSSVNSTARSYVAAVDTSGTRLSFNPNLGGNVNAIAADGSNVYFGGAFETVSGLGRAGVAVVAPS